MDFRTWTSRVAALFAVMVAVAVGSANSTHADASIVFPPPSSTDLWDVSQGTTVTGTSGIYPGINPANMFGGTGGVEPANTIFADGKPAGTVHWIEWQTSSPVTIASAVLEARHDGDNGRDANYRGMSRFKLFARDTGGAWIQLFDIEPANPYGDTVAPANTGVADIPSQPYRLLLCANLALMTATEFRAEVTQRGNVGGAQGPRIIELDGYATPCETANSKPTADAGPDQVVEATAGGTVVTLDGSGSSDPDSDPLTFNWTGPFQEGGGNFDGVAPVVTFPGPGTFAVELTVDDGNGGSDADTVEIQVVDTTPPVLSGLDDIGVEAPSDAGVVVAFDIQATDAADEAPVIDCTPPSGSTFLPGTTTVECMATDLAGNQAFGSFDVTVTVQVVEEEVTFESLADDVRGLELAGLYRTQLLLRLALANWAFEAGLTESAHAYLAAFIDYVERLTPRRISVDEAEALTDGAHALIATVHGEPPGTDVCGDWTSPEWTGLGGFVARLLHQAACS